MMPITTTTEVDRPPEDVFVYVTDPARFSEWQRNVVGGHMDADGPTTVGTKLDEGRRSRLTIDFEGDGIGRLLVPLAVRRQVRSEKPANLRSAKERLEQQR